MRILRYRGNTYNSPEPLAEAPRPGERSYRWVKYAAKSNNVVDFSKRTKPENEESLAG